MCSGQYSYGVGSLKVFFEKGILKCWYNIIGGKEDNTKIECIWRVMFIEN